MDGVAYILFCIKKFGSILHSLALVQSHYYKPSITSGNVDLKHCPEQWGLAGANRGIKKLLMQNSVYTVTHYRLAKKRKVYIYVAYDKEME